MGTLGLDLTLGFKAWGPVGSKDHRDFLCFGLSPSEVGC